MKKAITYYGSDPSDARHIFGVVRSDCFVRAYSKDQYLFIEGIYPFSGASFTHCVICDSSENAKTLVSDIYKCLMALEE